MRLRQASHKGCHTTIAGGRALLMLTPGEAQGMRAALEAAAIPTKPLRMNPAKMQAVGPALQALCSKDAELKVLMLSGPLPAALRAHLQLTMHTSIRVIQQLACVGPYPMQLLVFASSTCCARSICAVKSMIRSY